MQRHPDDIVTFRYQHPRNHGAVDSAGHRDKHPRIRRILGQAKGVPAQQTCFTCIVFGHRSHLIHDFPEVHETGVGPRTEMHVRRAVCTFPNSSNIVIEPALHFAIPIVGIIQFRSRIG